jgi:hypothetical protein
MTVIKNLGRHIIPDGWEIEWENDDEEGYAWMASCVYHVFSLLSVV